MSVSSAEDVYLRLLWRIYLQLQYELSKGLIEWRHRTGNELIAVQMPYELSNRLTTRKKTRHVTHLPDSSPENLSNIHAHVPSRIQKKDTAAYTAVSSAKTLSISQQSSPHGSVHKSL